MRAATNPGFRSTLGDPLGPTGVVVGGWWVTVVLRLGPPAPWGGSVPLVPSEARGVGHIAARVGSPGVFLSTWLGPFAFALCAAGVGHIFRPFVASGDGHEPETFTLVGGTNGGRGEQTPLRIEPERGKITEDIGKSSTNNSWDVLQEHVSGSHVADDPGDVGPDPTVVVNTQLLP